MPVVTEFPPRLKNKDFQRNSPERNLDAKVPPIQFIPAKASKSRNPEDRTNIKIAFPSGITKSYRVFSAGNLEHAISHVRLVQTIIKDTRLPEDILAAEAELKEKVAALDLLVPRGERPQSNTPSSHLRFPEESPESTADSPVTETVSPSNIETLKSEILELEGNLKNLHESVFDTFEQSLAASLQAQFRLILKEQCDGADYVDLEGTRIRGIPRGRVFSALRPVAMAWLRLYAGEEDAYEVTLRMIQNHVLMNTEKISVEAGVYRFKELNQLLMWCPSRKHLENAPLALPAPRELTEFELCTAVLASQMKHVQTQYNASHGTTFACELEPLARLLKRSAEAVQSNRNMLNQFKRVANGNEYNKQIPKKKARFADRDKKEPGEVARSGSKKKKECERCAQWKPHIKNTHWTSECKIYEADGSLKPRGGGGKRGGVKSQKKYNNALSQVKQLKEQLKEQKKKHKKSRRKRRRRSGGYSSSSSSDSSDSDA